MDTIEKIKKYIADTKIPQKTISRYSTTINELNDIADIGEQSPCSAAILALSYGMAKGYRAAKAEMKGEKK